jgi:hypothetical protein
VISWSGRTRFPRVETTFVIQHLRRAAASHGTVSGHKKAEPKLRLLSFSALPLAARRLAA